MTKPAADPRDLVDRTALKRFLAGALPSFNDVSVSLLSGGASNLTFMLGVDGRRYVLRRRPQGESAPRAHDMRREFLAIQALARVDFPVPRAIAYTDDKDIVGEPCYLMEFVEGDVLHTPDDVRTLTPATAAACSIELVDTLARLHSIDPAGVGLGSFGRPEGFLQRRIASWLRQWRAVQHRDLPDVEVLGERLLDRLPAEGGSALVHGDYRLGNVLFTMSPAPRLTAVLDWEMSTLGDPLTDLAHLLVYWEPTRGRLTHPSQLIAEHPGFLNGTEVVERYSALTHRDVSALPFYLAFEHWRAAIIKDAIYLRAKARQASGISGDFMSLGESVQRHLEEAADVLADIAPVAMADRRSE